MAGMNSLLHPYVYFLQCCFNMLKQHCCFFRGSRLGGVYLSADGLCGIDSQHRFYLAEDA